MLNLFPNTALLMENHNLFFVEITLAPLGKMDPSEFEGTVARKSDALSLSTLENLLETPAAKFENIDLSTEVKDIYMNIFKIKDTLRKWDEISLSNLRLAWDEQAVKISEFKQEILGRKKSLAQKIKEFSSKYMNESSSEESSIQDEKHLRIDIEDLISSFKVEFDFAGSTSRFAEASFLSTYKILRDIPDPAEEMEDCLNVCIRIQDVLQKCREQLDIAALSTSNNNTGYQISAFTTTSTTTNNDEAIIAKYDARIEELQQTFQSNLSDLTSKNNFDLRNKEHALRSSFEQQLLELQQQYDSIIATKDSELASLLSSLNDYNQKSLESQERHGMLQSEVNKRRELEERLRVALTDLAAATTTAQEIQNR